MKLGLLFILFSSQIYAQDSSNNNDLELRSYIKQFKYKAKEVPTGFVKAKFDLGKSLFFDRNIFCSVKNNGVFYFKKILVFN